MNEPRPLLVRLAALADLPSIVRIYNQSIPERNATCDLDDTTLEDRIPWFHSHTSQYPLWVAEWDGEVAGWACISPYSDKPGYRRTVENSVYIDRAFRGRGAGRALMERLMDEAKRLGYHAVLAKVFAHNPASLALHRAFGFTEMAFLKEVALMDGVYRDVAILVRLFDGPAGQGHNG